MSGNVMARYANPSKRKYPKRAAKFVKAELAHEKAKPKSKRRSRKQVIAIGLSEARKAGVKVPRKRSTPKKHGVSTMAKKRRKSGSRPKRRKGRSAAQRAATARLVAMNKSRRGGKRRRTTKRRRKNPTAGAATMSNPTRKRRRRARKHNPKKHHTHFHAVKQYSRKKTVRRHKRRTNPSLPTWARIAGAAVLGAVLPAATKAIARKVAPAHAELIGHVTAGAAVLGAISFGKKYPLFAPALAAGSVAADLAPTVSAKVEKLLASTSQEAAVAEARLQGVRFIERLGAVTADDMGAVTADDMGYLPESPYGMGTSRYVY